MKKRQVSLMAVCVCVFVWVGRVGGEHSLMDWDELAGSCTTPWGEIRQCLEACENERRREGSAGILCYRLLRIKDSERR